MHDTRHSTCFLDAGNKDGFYEGGPIIVSSLALPSMLITDLIQYSQVCSGPLVIRKSISSASV